MEGFMRSSSDSLIAASNGESYPQTRKGRSRLGTCALKRSTG
jgi:hypothetical protein